MLEIELITTKKKLTLSIVKQMPVLSKSIAAMQCCEVLGHIKHPSLHKGVSTAIVKYNEVYYALTLYNWKTSTNPVALYTKLGNGYSTKTVFSSERHCKEWLELFSLIKTKALATHIYL